MAQLNCSNNKLKIIASGAEAIILKSEKGILKYRQKKSYRIAEIDDKLRTTRTKRESTILKKLAEINFPSPKILFENSKQGKLEIEFLSGPKVRDILDTNLNGSKNGVVICKEIGKRIATLHNENIIHGDLTTSNMIYHNKQVYLIDFGLSYFSKRVEDKAVDLHLLRQALESKHCKVWEKAYALCLEGYKEIAKRAKETINRLDVVESRGRYKGKGS